MEREPGMRQWRDRRLLRRARSTAFACLMAAASAGADAQSVLPGQRVVVTDAAGVAWTCTTGSSGRALCVRQACSCGRGRACARGRALLPGSRG